MHVVDVASRAAASVLLPPPARSGRCGERSLRRTAPGGTRARRRGCGGESRGARREKHGVPAVVNGWPHPSTDCKDYHELSWVGAVLPREPVRGLASPAHERGVSTRQYAASTASSEETHDLRRKRHGRSAAKRQ